jgi:DNA-binding transcriptional LysR family regulator
VVNEVARKITVDLPHTRLKLWEGSSTRLPGWFRQQRLDMLWGNVDDLTANTKVLWREPLVAAVAAEHPYARLTGGISVRDLAKVPFIHRSHCELDAIGRNKLKASGVTLDVQMRAEREELAFQLVRSQRGITLAPKSLVPPDLVTLAVSGLDIERTIGLQWQEKTPLELITALSTVINEVKPKQVG